MVVDNLCGGIHCRRAGAGHRRRRGSLPILARGLPVSTTAQQTKPADMAGFFCVHRATGRATEPQAEPQATGSHRATGRATEPQAATGHRQHSKAGDRDALLRPSLSLTAGSPRPKSGCADGRARRARRRRLVPYFGKTRF